MRDPILHAGVTDCLPDAHPWAFESVECGVCGVGVHALNNETLCAWVETGLGAYCLACYARADAEGEPHYLKLALPDEIDGRA